MVAVRPSRLRHFSRVRSRTRTGIARSIYIDWRTGRVRVSTVGHGSAVREKNSAGRCNQRRSVVVEYAGDVGTGDRGHDDDGRDRSGVERFAAAVFGLCTAIANDPGRISGLSETYTGAHDYVRGIRQAVPVPHYFVGHTGNDDCMVS